MFEVRTLAEILVRMSDEQDTYRLIASGTKAGDDIVGDSIDFATLQRREIGDLCLYCVKPLTVTGVTDVDSGSPRNIKSYSKAD